MVSQGALSACNLDVLEPHAGLKLFSSVRAGQVMIIPHLAPFGVGRSDFGLRK